MSSTTPLLRFGIPSLDQLFSASGKPEEWGIKVPADNSMKGVTSVCIAGPSGTGKSVLAMHMASRYYADCAALHPWNESKRPTVIHVSTDLSEAQADVIWESFALHLPGRRNPPFISETVPPTGAAHDALVRELNVELKPCRFASEGDFSKLARMMEKPCQQSSVAGMPTPSPKGEVIFLNLAESTAGDDWNFVIRIISLLRPPISCAPHLLIIDAVEGMELTVGHRDAHGEERSRRSRIAQLLRHAAGKCHVVLVREEKDPRSELPEEFVTDAVLRLRSEDDGQYLRRTLEVVKSRGQPSIRGTHHYLIRGGKPGTPKSINPDDPGVSHPAASTKTQSYIHVCPSLHSLTRTGFMEEPPGVRTTFEAVFEHPRLPGILPNNGLPGGRVTVLTGDEATTKGRFARAFLAGAFQAPLSPLPSQSTAERGGGVAVLITTNNLPKSEIVAKLKLHGQIEGAEVPETRFIYRQLEVHDLSSAVLLHIIRRCIDQALEAAGVDLCQRQWAAPCVAAKNVRVVIDDWSVIQTIYPAVAADPLFLPFVIRYLERVGVTTLIVETQPGRPGDVFRSEAPRHLRSLVAHHLFTWHVPFYGEDKVAITAVPPLRDNLGSPVVELRPPLEGEAPEDALGERLYGDPHFELYRGLELGVPEPVPLSVQLFAAAEGFSDYAKLTDAVLNRVFVPTKEGGNVVESLPPKDYASMRDFSFLHSGARANHTVVFTVDEYWPDKRPGAHNDETPYLAQLTRENGTSRLDNDPYESFQRENAQQQAPHTKSTFFPLEHIYGTDAGIEQSDSWKGDRDWHEHYDKIGLVPYLWDFGFLMLDEEAWLSALARLQADEKAKVEAAWKYFINPKKDKPKNPDELKELTWRDFLKACALVAQAHVDSTDGHLAIFKAETLTAQTFACLVLEMWFSEIGASRLTGPGKRFSETRLVGKGREPELRNLSRLLEEYTPEFYRVWLLLGEVVDPHDVLDERNQLKSGKTNHRVVAERHWYSTASRLVAGRDIFPRLRPVRLPGQYVARGDWFLTTGRESRSLRLGERAIDFLSRRRANIARLEHGLGLPVRDILFEHDTKHSQKAETEKAARYKEIETALHTVDAGGAIRRMNYREVRELGVAYPWETPKDPRHWLWRSQLTDYHRHDRIFERWIARLFVKAAELNRELHLKGTDGFKQYDTAQNIPDEANLLKWPRYDAFKSMVKVMREDLDKGAPLNREQGRELPVA